MTAATIPATLKELIDEVVRGTDLVDPDDLADEVVRRTPPEALRSFYRQAVRDPIRIRLHKAPTPEPEPRPQHIPGTGATAAPVRSRKYAAIAAWFEAQMSRREFVEGVGWKMHGECTRSDFLALAADRRGKAAELTTAAVYYEHIAAALSKLPEGATARDLAPEDYAAAVK